ncbi:MAG: RecX family transcriptional regulator [Bryobacterales bacterium]|nr:RecX family transcriptional regulator [Bryobacterales bacterium]
MQTRKTRLLEAGQLKDHALKLLAGRALSVGELREKLRRRAAVKGDVDGIIASLKEMKVLNDRQYAEHFAGVRKESRGFGRERALADLLKKRVAPQVARQAVGKAYEGADEAAMIEAYLARKYRAQNLAELLKDQRGLAAAFRRLRGAGFSSGNSIRVLKRYSSEADQLEGMDESSGVD